MPLGFPTQMKPELGKQWQKQQKSSLIKKMDSMVLRPLQQITRTDITI